MRKPYKSKSVQEVRPQVTQKYKDKMHLFQVEVEVAPVIGVDTMGIKTIRIFNTQGLILDPTYVVDPSRFKKQLRQFLRTIEHAAFNNFGRKP